MTMAEALDLTLLYEQDETAWLETMSALAVERAVSRNGPSSFEPVSSGHGQT